jgi:outer membrane protein assembly factor BamB
LAATSLATLPLPAWGVSAVTSHAPSTCLAGPIDALGWTVYGGTPAHSGYDIGHPPSAGVLYVEWKTPRLDGAVYAEPVVADGCLIVATENDSLYAFDAFSGALRWHDHLANPASGGALPCGDISPSGITGTPVVDPARVELWVVELTEGDGGPEHLLVGVDIKNGHVFSTRRVDPPGSSPAAVQQRGALNLSNSNVYIPFGGLYGDCANYHGTLASVPEAPGHRPAFWVVPTAREAGIWAPGGADVLPDGDLLVTTGNGAAGPGQRWDGGNGVFRLSPALRVESSFAPATWAKLSASDLDLGSTSPAVLPGGLALQVGKSGTGYLLETRRLGGIGGQLYRATVCPNGGAFGNDAVDGDTVYVPCQAGLTAVQVHGRRFRVLWSSSSASPGSPVVAGGKVWQITANGLLQGIWPATGRVAQYLQLADPMTHFPWLVALGATMYAPDGDRVMDLTGL